MIKNTEVHIFFINSIFFNLIGLIIYYLLTSIYGLDPVLTITIASPFIFISNYVIQAKFIFKKNVSLKSFMKFILNVAGHYFMNIILLFCMVNIMNLNHIISQIVILIFLFFLNYVISKKIIFENN
jgi:putative flippase GtrA